MLVARCRHALIPTLVALLGCAPERTRAGGVADCEECRFSPDGVVSQGSPPDLDGDDAGVPAGSLSGVVNEVFSEDLMSLRPLTLGEVEISAPALSGFTRATYDGTEPYVLEGVNTASSVWIAVEPGLGASTLTTLQLVDASRAQADLAAVSRDVLESLAVSAALANPAELDPARGHIVVSFVDALGRPIPGVSVVTLIGSSVAYDAGETFSDQLLETDTRGAVLLLNVPASALPGSDQQISFSAAGETVTLTVRVARDAITLVASVL